MEVALALTVVGLLIFGNYLVEFVIEPRRMRSKIIKVLLESPDSLTASEIQSSILATHRFFGVSNVSFQKALQYLIVSKRILTDDNPKSQITLRYYMGYRGSRTP